MRLAADRRGRVPFALVGVVLLVASTTYAAGIGGGAVAVDRPDSAAALREAQATTRTVLHEAVEGAARAAGREPVIEPAGTPAGDALSADDPFRDSLRLRIYHRAQRSLPGGTAPIGGVRARPSLPAIGEGIDVREAIERVHLRPGPTEGTLNVTVEGVAVVIERREATLGTHRYGPTVVVRAPTLALHRAVERYDDRLSGPGPSAIERRVTRSLFALAWARGYAQFYGAPIENVVSNRHVAVLLNRALLAEQRAALGRWDSAGRAAMGNAVTGALLSDLVAPHAPPGTDPLAPVEPATATGNRTIAVDVGEVATAAANALRANGSDALAGVLAGAGPTPDRAAAIENDTIDAARRALEGAATRASAVTVEVPARSILDGPPTDRLREHLATRRPEMVRAAGETDALADGTRRHLVDAYLATLDAALGRSGRVANATLAGVDRRVGATRRALGGLGVTPAVAGSSTGSGSIVAAVNATPSYLAHDIDRTTPAGPVFAGENVNWFALPVGDVAEAAAGAAVDADGAAGGGERSAVVFGGLVERGLERVATALRRGWARKGLAAVPAGLPITPVPTYWFATINGWSVRAEAGYRRFAVRAPGPDPTPSPSMRYVRRNGTVSLPLGEGGEPVRLGWNRELRVELATTVAVVVPPGPRGVGDRVTRTERSPGWDGDDRGQSGSSSAGE